MNFISEDKKTINLPVPLGATLYRIITACNDACMLQAEKFNSVFPSKEGGRCSVDMPCHTKLHSALPFVFALGDLDWVLKKWQITCFETESGAKEAGENLIEAHKQQLLALGLNVE